VTVDADHDREPDEQRILLGVVWRDHTPHLRTRTIDQDVSELVPVEGWRLSYRIPVEPLHTCLGHVPFRSSRTDFHDCSKEPRAGSRRCERCSIVEATFASNLHHAHTKGSAELDASVRDHLQQPNRLYLAAFRDGSIKIGTSTLARSDKRLEEQGAWMARFVAETADGRAVRHLEDAVTETAGIAQSVSAIRKSRGLVSPLSDDRLDAELQQAVADAHGLVIDKSAGGDVTAMDEIWRHPMADHPAMSNLLAYPLTLQTGAHDLRVVTAIGRHLIVTRSNGDDHFVVDPAPLFGLWLDMGDFGSGEIAIQDSLF